MILPSEELEVEIVRAGKEKNQGLAYLSDGTMIVVEEAKKRIGEKLKVEITTCLLYTSILVEEPSEEDAIKIIEGLKDKYEAHHRVLISHAAIEAAVTLSKRYISDRYLPDKAIYLIDEAQSLVRMKNYVRPLSLKEIEDELKEISSEKIQAIQAQDFERAAQLRDKERELKDKMDLDRTEWKQKSELNSMKIGFDDIARVVSKWTGIPVEKLSEEEKEKLLKLDNNLKERVIGQDEAIDCLLYTSSFG